MGGIWGTERARWYEDRRREIDCAFYRWATEHPEANEDSDFTILIAVLVAIWRNGRVPHVT